MSKSAYFPTLNILQEKVMRAASVTLVQGLSGLLHVTVCSSELQVERWKLVHIFSCVANILSLHETKYKWRWG